MTQTLVEFTGDYNLLARDIASLLGVETVCSTTMDNLTDLIHLANSRALVGYEFGPHIDAPECFGYWLTL